INAGGVSYGTQRLIPVLDECLTYQPDLVILCTGHNEFLERQIYDQLPAPAIKIAQAIHGLHLYRALQSVFPPTLPAKSPLPSEVDTLLDHPGGLESFHYDPEWRKHVIATFDQNLNRLVDAAQTSNTPILLVHPPSNLKDCPPFKSDFTSPTTGSQKSHWQSLLATHQLQESLEIDPLHPLAHYLIGQHYIGTGDTANALKHLTLARDHDTCPLRILSPMEQTLRAVSQKSNTPLVDAQILLAKECTATIPGSQVLVDHVHPSIRGHQLIAEHLLKTVSTTLGLASTGNWQSHRSALYQTHIDALPPLYFTHGLRRLRAVNAWTEGRVQATQSPRETRPADTE
ncbi:MAG: hypothetical protein P8J87_19140, partial [Verrucomicrobiales bacterium]|nr:hypothetical protein [Verrucomicrobiales bacterium]